MSESDTAVAVPPVKKRYEWIDNSRVIAAFLIMYVHLPLALPQENFFNTALVDYSLHHTKYSGRVALFLMLSGYLYSRNAAWGKTLDRFFWLLVPFVLWIVIITAVYWALGMPVSHNPFEVFGIGAVFHPSLVISSAGPTWPTVDVPAWYMRDMLPLTLLTPVFLRFRRFLPLVLFFFALLYTGDKYMNPRLILAPSTCFFFLVGICLSRFKFEDGYRLFTDRLTPVVIAAFLAALGICVWHTKFNGPGISITLLGMLTGAMMIAHCGVMIEKHFPRLSKRLAPLGPASFLVFMVHYPIFEIVKYFCPALTRSLWVVALPIPTFIVIVTLFLLMKRYTPWLMPYLGHMKIAKKPQLQPRRAA